MSELQLSLAISKFCGFYSGFFKIPLSEVGDQKPKLQEKELVKVFGTRTVLYLF